MGCVRDENGPYAPYIVLHLASVGPRDARWLAAPGPDRAVRSWVSVDPRWAVGLVVVGDRGGPGGRPVGTRCQPAAGGLAVGAVARTTAAATDLPSGRVVRPCGPVASVPAAGRHHRPGPGSWPQREGKHRHGCRPSTGPAVRP